MHANVGIRVSPPPTEHVKTMRQGQAVSEVLPFWSEGFGFSKCRRCATHCDDIPVLTRFFMRKHSSLLGDRVLSIANDVLNSLKAYHFPSNVRELKTKPST